MSERNHLWSQRNAPPRQSLRERAVARLWEALTPAPVKRLLESVLTQLAEPGWTLLGAGIAGIEDDPIQRRDALVASYYYWQRDPLYGRAVRLTRNYTFGRGIAWRANDEEVRQVLEEFWGSADNKLFTRAQGQWELCERMILAGELFPILFVNRYSGKVKASLSEPNEVTAVISDPENSRRALYYQREWRKRLFDWTSKSWSGTSQTTDFYPDWEACLPGHRQAQSGDDDPWAVWAASQSAVRPEHATVGDEHTAVYMAQFKVNSHSQRGLPAFYSGITWVKGYKGFMEDRATLTLAAATFAFKQKIKGGAAAVSRLVSQWGSHILGRYGGGRGRERREGAQTIIENEASNLEQLNFDTRAGNAYQDGRMLRQQVAAATDITEPDLTGDPSVGNLASMTAMNGPQLKGFESWQQLFKDIYLDLFNFVIRMAVKYGDLTLVDEHGQERDLTVEVDFPPLVVADLPMLVGAISSLISAQSIAQREYISPRRLASYALQAFGETDVETALDELEFETIADVVDSVEDFTAAVEVLREALAESDWSERKHPRAKSGQFKGKGGGGGGGSKKKSNSKSRDGNKNGGKRDEEGKQDFSSATAKEADEWAGSQKGINPDVTEAEDVALGEYKGEAFYDVNSDLREYGYSDVYDAQIEAIDSAFEKTKLDTPTTVHRGVGYEMLDDFGGDDLSGSTIIDDAYVSTSLRRGVASAHADGGIVEIRVPAGAQAIFMDRWKVTGWDSESELLLPRGSKFRVISDDTDPDNRKMVWELIL